ncbi:TonB-dependent siderophore receptor [Occallatibacter riparius]|uniref:TonB-dependent siderophore receptor n=1 Tax=Occallatibacter riparius TaxID=1002689 RepID=A0A9J7BQK1_9BACT|nr:TonB-dependent siderophore receptor [Occallatibacter riparius]UWZ85083.1 TonB-dependent siderophore receptor [Occallatibacter riparius]
MTTTVVVHEDVKDDYLSNAITTGTLDNAPLAETPLSISVVTRELLSDQGARTLADVVKNDASVGEDYAPVGYYGDFQIRGFPIDLATGLQINGMTIAGEQDVPLENKERVEILKGISGVESGVTSGGGVIGYVTKRPALVKAMDMATDHRGSAFGAADFGQFFGKEKQVGARLNLAGESIQSYVNGADGWRAMGAGSADWKITPKAILKGDFEYQHKVERSVSGYQLLGGDTLPDLNRIYPSTMLGFQPWAKPNTFDTYNTGARFDYDLPGEWHVFGAASFSHSLIDDNVVYPYGVPYDDQGNVACPDAPDAPYYFFCPDGTYGIYDYRNPGELRIDAQAESVVTGQWHTGAIQHDLAGGVELFRRSVQMPGYFSAETPVSPDGVVQDGAVYSYIGQENIYQPIEPFHWATNENGITQQAGPRRLWEDHHQTALMVADRLHLPGRIQVNVGGRETWLRDHNYSLGATDPAAAPTNTDRPVWLPQYAVSFTPVTRLMLYGTYTAMLSLGPQAPWWVDNGSQFLEPYFTRQVEAGAKYEPNQKILLSVAGFHMRAPFFYPKTIAAEEGQCTEDYFFGPGTLCFVSQGHETHSGAEFSVEGKAANWIKLNASVAAIHAESQDTGTPEFDNKQVINAPRVRTALFADVAVPHMRGFYLMPGWGYCASKEATRDDAVSVPGFNLFNLGARYTPGGEQGHMTLRLYADNIANKRYWKDTGASLGDTFIHLGAPATVRLSAHYTF